MMHDKMHWVSLGGQSELLYIGYSETFGLWVFYYGNIKNLIFKLNNFN